MRVQRGEVDTIYNGSPVVIGMHEGLLLPDMRGLDMKNTMRDFKSIGIDIKLILFDIKLIWKRT